MSMSITVDEAQSKLKDLIHQLSPGDEIIITENSQPIAKLVGEATKPRKPRIPGTLRGTVTYMAPDFNAPLDEFKDYVK